jgi:hypothetical protein
VRPCEQSVAQQLCRSAAGPGFDVPVIYRICERRDFGQAGIRRLASQSMANLAELRSLRVGQPQASQQLGHPVFRNQIPVAQQQLLVHGPRDVGRIRAPAQTRNRDVLRMPKHPATVLARRARRFGAAVGNRRTTWRDVVGWGAPVGRFTLDV